MAVLTDQFRRYVTRMLQSSVKADRPAYVYDPILAQVEQVGDPERKGTLSFAVCPPYQRKDADQIMRGYTKTGVVGAAEAHFAAVVDGTIDAELERKVVALKEGFPSLPATTCAKILKGLNCEIQQEQVLAIYGSYGTSRATKTLAETFNFTELNRRAHRLQQLIEAGSEQEGAACRCVICDACLCHRPPRRSGASNRRIRLEEELVLLLLEGLSTVWVVRAC